MSNFNRTHKISAATAFGAAAVFSMLSFGSNAEAASVTGCQGNTAGAVVSCCEKLTSGQRPSWMFQSRTRCSQIVVCGGKKDSDNRCYVRVVLFDRGGGGDNIEEGGDPGSSPNTPR